MKSIYFSAVISFSALVLFSCSDKKGDGKGVPSFSEHVTAAPKPAEEQMVDTALLVEQGKVLVENADCLSCHKISEKMIGPSYKEVAEKYTVSDLNYLTDKIIDGGSGVWGNVPMAAHTGLTKENSRKMVYYILSTK